MNSGIRRARACAPVLACVCLAVFAASAGARTSKRVLRPVATHHRMLIFDVTKLRGSHVRRAELQTAGRTRRVSPHRVNAALSRGRLRLRRPATSRRLHGASASTAAATKLQVVASSCGGSSSAYRDEVVASAGLVSYLRLDETSGSTACDSAGTRSGTYVGGVSRGRAGAIAGDPDDAVALDGASGTVRIGNASALSPSSRLTLEAWIRPAALTSSQTVIRKDGQYLLRLEGGRLVFRLWSPGGSQVELSSPGVVAAQSWQHVAAVYDGSAMRLYLNGTQVATRARTGDLRRASNELYVGSSTGSYDYFAGTVDEAAVYGSALTASAVARHYALGTGGSTPSDPTPAPSPSPTPTPSPSPTPTPSPSPTPTPSPSGTASVTCGFGTFTAGNWPTACWRPYADSSPFNRTLPASPKVLSNSSAMVQRILGMGQIADMEVAPDTSSDWYHPTYYNSPSDPIYTVHCVKYSCETEGMQVRIPAQARPAAGGDGHMTVVDQASGWEWDFWQVQSRPAGGGTLNVSDGGRTLIAGDGLGSDANAGQWGLLGGIIRAPEMQAGRIDHALFMLVGCTSSGHVYPAAGDAGHCSDPTDAPQDGQLLQLDMSDSEIDALAVPAWKKTILRAMAHYGAYIGDTGGNEAFSLQFESGSTYTSFGVTDPMATFASQQSSGVTQSSGKWYFDLASGVDWAHRLRVLDPCVARGDC